MTNYYKDAFNDGRNLTEASLNFPKTQYRPEIVSKAIQVLARRRSVLLVGAPGVGKTRVVHEMASQMRQSGRTDPVA